jgi:hypothetical protein
MSAAMWQPPSTLVGIGKPSDFACQAVPVLTSPYPRVELALGKFVRFR